MADQVEEVKRKTDIVSLVSERVKLQRAGRNFKALCPFHSERTPSFMVSPELQIFKCFGCSKAGDVYTFLNEFDGMEFPEALSFLAKRAGVRLRPTGKGKDYQKRQRLRELNHLASEYFHYLLSEHEVGKKAMRYLAQRGVRKSSIQTFKLGFAPDSWDALIRYLVRKKQYSIGELREVGLVVKGSRRTYDRFRNRVIFPLRDVSGNVLGFAGRILPGVGEASASAEATVDKRAKYINSPETVLYHKSEHLYGLHETRSHIKKKDEVVVVEGELDVIASWQAGVKYVVAVKGTALTREQVELVRRYTRNVVLALDADAAGDAATKRGISLADKASLNIKVVLLVRGKDPDAIAQDDPKKWRKLVDRATSVYNFFISSARQRFGTSSGLGKKQISEELVPVLSSITNAVEQAHYIKKVARLLAVLEEAVLDEINRFRRTQSLEAAGSLVTSTSSSKDGAKRDRRVVLEEYFLSLILQGGAQAASSLDGFEPHDLTHPPIRRIFEQVLKDKKTKFKAGTFIASLPAELRVIAQAAFLRDLSDIPSNPEVFSQEIGRVISEIRQFRLRGELQSLSTKIKALESARKPTSADEKKLTALRRKFSELTRKLSD